MILFGPPGIGKTVIATAMANYLGWHYCYITPEDFTFKDKLDINRAFRFILNNSGKIWKHLEYTVLIFDEIEEVVGHRGKEGTDIARRLATTNMLTKFEQLRKDAENREILIVVCTNHLENLDPAFIRRGRFDWLVPVTTPDRRARYQMFSIAMEEEPKVMLHHDPEKHKVGLHSLSRISQGLTYAEIVELCKNAKVQFGKEASLREFERAVLKLTEKPAINRKDLELVEEESRTFARGHPFEYQTNLNNAIDNEFGRILVYAELEEAPVGPGRDCAIYIKVVNLTDFELENVEMIYRSEDLDPNYKGKGRESLYGKTIFNNIETCYGRISFKENKIQPNDDRDYTLHHRLKNYYMLNKKEREYIRLLTYLTADIRVKLSDSQSLGRYFVRPGSFIAKTVRVPSDEEHPIVIPGWQNNTFFLHLSDFSHRKKYEAVRTILGEAGFKDSECLGMQKDILAMIHKGIIPKEIAKTIKKIRE